MKSNRRSVLIGLGALTVGGGAVFGTGAFSSVEANRQVSVSTASDSAALLTLSPDSDYVTEEDGQIVIDVSDVNIDGTLTVDSAFTIDNDHTEQITLDESWEVTEDEITVTLEPASTTLDPEDSPTSVELEIDTEDAAEDADISTEITIAAST